MLDPAIQLKIMAIIDPKERRVNKQKSPLAQLERPNLS